MILENSCGEVRALCWFRKVRDSAGTQAHGPGGRGETPARLQPEETTSLQALRFPFSFIFFFILAVSLSFSHKAGRFWWEVGVWRANTHMDVVDGQFGLVGIVGSAQRSGTQEPFHRLALAWLLMVGTDNHTHPLFDLAWAAALATRRPRVPLLTRDGVRSRWAPPIKNVGKQRVLPGWATAVHITIQPHERCHLHNSF